MSKITLAILCGGPSSEHTISLWSAKAVIEAVDRQRYALYVIGIARDGTWQLYETDNYLSDAEDAQRIALQNPQGSVTFRPGCGGKLYAEGNKGIIATIDVVFPVLHGPYGEDGCMQGFLKTCGVPFVGSGVLSSAIAMDKDIANRLVEQAGFSAGTWRCVKSKTGVAEAKRLLEVLGLPCFVKPANAGSAMGVQKVKTAEDLPQAMMKAFEFDEKILVETEVVGREIECAVLGNAELSVALPGEIISHGDFYDFEAKYVQAADAEGGASVVLAKELTPAQIKTVQDLALNIYQVLQCEGFARVDFFLTADGRFIFNELNTIPGFTRISQFPKLWEASGLAFPALVDKLVELALEKRKSASAVLC